jgi:integrase
MPTLERLAEACGRVHQSHSGFVTLAALLAARSSEVSGLRAGDADFGRRVVVMSRQAFPGAGGLVTKQTKSRKARAVPILNALDPALRRLAAGKPPRPGSWSDRAAGSWPPPPRGTPPAGTPLSPPRARECSPPTPNRPGQEWKNPKSSPTNVRAKSHA